jgi:hypothetical protein
MKIRVFAMTIAATRKTASLEFDAAGSRIQAAVENPVAGERSATFKLTAEAWRQEIRSRRRILGREPSRF